MGAVTFFNAGTTAVGTRNRGLMFFDLGTLIPVGAIITSVELHLDVVAQPSSMQPFTLSFSYLPVQNTNALTLTAWPTGGTGVATGLVVLPTLPLALPVPSLAIAATYLKLTNMTATFNDLGGLAWLPRHPQPAAIARDARTIFSRITSPRSIRRRRIISRTTIITACTPTPPSPLLPRNQNRDLVAAGAYLRVGENDLEPGGGVFERDHVAALAGEQGGPGEVQFPAYLHPAQRRF